MTTFARLEKGTANDYCSRLPRDIDFAKFREIADEVGLLADISHPSGLIATGLLSNPILTVTQVMTNIIKH